MTRRYENLQFSKMTYGYSKAFKHNFKINSVIYDKKLTKRDLFHLVYLHWGVIINDKPLTHWNKKAKCIVCCGCAKVYTHETCISACGASRSKRIRGGRLCGLPETSRVSRSKRGLVALVFAGIWSLPVFLYTPSAFIGNARLGVPTWVIACVHLYIRAAVTLDYYTLLARARARN